jgi:hypothetical protein
MQAPKAMSFLISINVCLDSSEYSWDSPEPDFWKWFSKVSSGETGTSEDYLLDEKLPDEEKRSWKVFDSALRATIELLEYQEKHPESFRKVARQMTFLPGLLSWHPDCDRFNQALLKTTELGVEGLHRDFRRHPNHLKHQSWPTRYAYDIVSTIDVNLDTYGYRLESMAKLYGFGKPHPLTPQDIDIALQRMKCSDEKKAQIRKDHIGAYQFLPLWAEQLLKIERRFCKSTVLDYWRIGKAILLEEVPDFHQRPEWRSYQTRHFANGATPGAVQHAIFRDILDALKSIAPDEPVD